MCFSILPHRIPLNPIVSHTCSRGNAWGQARFSTPPSGTNRRKQKECGAAHVKGVFLLGGSYGTVPVDDGEQGRQEIGTDIVIFLTQDAIPFNDKTFDNLIKVAKKNNCKLLLPHPFHDHTNIEYLARNVDYIEIFNARCSELENQKAQELSNLLSKKSYASPDAHLLKEYNNCIIKYDATTDKDWREILDSNWSFHSNISAKQHNVYFSSLIKSVKLKSPEVFVKSLIRLLTFGYKFKRN